MGYFALRHRQWHKLQRQYQRLQAVPQGVGGPRFTLPFPAPDTPLSACRILSLDFETSGLDATQDGIVSMGWVPLAEGIISLRAARHMLVQSPAPVRATEVTLHHILPEMQLRGMTLDRAFDTLWQALPCPIILGHGTVIERTFIGQYLARCGLPEPPFIWLDTLKIEQSQPDSRGMVHGSGASWQLAHVRRRYGLPDYPAHQALVDAIATAELFQAQMYRLFGLHTPTLEQVYLLSR
ncbi:hypothetical protein KX274_23045 [Escherichia coli]|jgi:DNA polymerase-3 subunit epsilon|uniref:3'-5' exonuclease n=1 Tax=Klebsiella michiganensis TaxID=1134687 RepID=A0A2J4ZYU5_9ENTR|nr:MULTISPECIES: exonuclease domain-containing protein [Enterobacteriaceae]EAA3687577.1 3'-5' exonuclease [Salmonella enterica subsp. enterica serovar Kedougou]EAM8521096.1 3'-5' exonuclease [Salmonella enterica]NCC19623.1 3'-5' exonuclease [Candidatus Saccharibacteria bacterium]EAQ6126308.1 3'-5' exonuclease [Salmonella enterica]EAX4241892.1 3'-5' exonuclease [Salmonella enterica]